MTMIKRAIVREFGTPEAIQIEETELGAPAAGEVQVKNTAIGLNFIDCYQRSGLYPIPLPFVLGNEAAGIVQAVGEGVTHFKAGDRVVGRGPVGAYCQARNVSENSLSLVPSSVSDEEAAAIYLKGLTAYYLIHLTYEVTEDSTILVSAAAGGVGQILTQWAKAKGAKVIAMVGGEAKAEIARANGCDVVIDTLTQDFVAEVQAATDGQGVDVVYDSIGKDTFEPALDCLRPRGLMVSFGNATGPVSIPNLGALAAKGSLFVTRPMMHAYYPNVAAERGAAKKLFEAFAQGAFKVQIGQTFDLVDVQAAHVAIESRATKGASIIKP